MRLPDRRALGLDDQVLSEPAPGEDRLVLWLPRDCADGLRQWERISSVAPAKLSVKQGICAIPATALQATQERQGFFSRLFRRSATTGNGTWVLPTGAAVQQVGDRRTDLLLAWSEDATRPLDAVRIQSLWPESKHFEQLGKNLFLVSAPAVSTPAPQEKKRETAPPPRTEDSRQVAEQQLASARRQGDARRLAAALADMGALFLREKAPQRAGPPLEEALAILGRLGERSGESDVRDNLGTVALDLGQPARALELFNQALTCAREMGDQFAAKIALEHLGLAYLKLRDPARAAGPLDEALALAHAVGDQKHEAHLLWYAGIAHAEQGRQEIALDRLQAAVDLLKSTANPEASCFADYLHKYRHNEVDLQAVHTGPFVGGATPAGPSAGMAVGVSGPGLLRKALSAAGALARFVGSGMKTLSPEARQNRLQICATCEHHTGVRCRLCGCFTQVKSWLPHEKCPVGKWPGNS